MLPSVSVMLFFGFPFASSFMNYYLLLLLGHGDKISGIVIAAVHRFRANSLRVLLFFTTLFDYHVVP